LLRAKAPFYLRGLNNNTRLFEEQTKEVVADYAAIQVADPKISFCLRYASNDRTFSPLRQAATDAMEDTLTAIDDRLLGLDLDMRFSLQLKSEIRKILEDERASLAELGDCDAKFKAVIKQYFDTEIAPLKKGPKSAEELTKAILSNYKVRVKKLAEEMVEKFQA
jgi:hypothetical protein